MEEANTSNAEIRPSRLEGFARFFKRYMGVSSIVTAVLPIPVTALGAIPTYKFQTGILSTYTSLFCFLILGFIFYSRHQLARAMFPEQLQRKRSQYRKPGALLLSGRYLVRLLPLVLIIGSIVCAFKYQQLLVTSVVDKRAKFELLPTEVSDADILNKALESQTLESRWLMIWYLGIFMMAEGAFVIMAIKEHLQDLATLGDLDLMFDPVPIKADSAKVIGD
jgi:hypothetical protein